MKKFITIIFVLLSVVAVSQVAPSPRKYTMASASATVNVAHTHYALNPITWAAPFSLQFIFTKDQVAKEDSTVLTFEASIDGTTWYNTNIAGAPITAAGTNTTIAYSSTVASTAIAATSTESVYAGGSLFYTPTMKLTPPYFRATVTHYGTGTVTTTGYLYVKP